MKRRLLLTLISVSLMTGCGIDLSSSKKDAPKNPQTPTIQNRLDTDAKKDEVKKEESKKEVKKKASPFPGLANGQIHFNKNVTIEDKIYIALDRFQSRIYPNQPEMIVINRGKSDYQVILEPSNEPKLKVFRKTRNDSLWSKEYFVIKNKTKNDDFVFRADKKENEKTQKYGQLSDVRHPKLKYFEQHLMSRTTYDSPSYEVTYRKDGNQWKLTFSHQDLKAVRQLREEVYPQEKSVTERDAKVDFDKMREDFFKKILDLPYVRRALTRKGFGHLKATQVESISQEISIRAEGQVVKIKPVDKKKEKKTPAVKLPKKK